MDSTLCLRSKWLFQQVLMLVLGLLNYQVELSLYFALTFLRLLTLYPTKINPQHYISTLNAPQLPKLFTSYYPHKATLSVITAYNESPIFGTYYIATENYLDGHGIHWSLTSNASKGMDYNPDSDFQSRPFVLYTVRDSIKHRVCQVFCLSERGPRHCAVGSPVVESPWWEVVGEGDTLRKSVNANGEIVDKLQKGERETRTGNLCVRIPGDHVLKFFDRGGCTELVKKMKPLFFN